MYSIITAVPMRLSQFLNQARAWFLKITSVWMYVCVCPQGHKQLVV